MSGWRLHGLLLILVLSALFGTLASLGRPDFAAEGRRSDERDAFAQPDPPPELAEASARCAPDPIRPSSSEQSPLALLQQRSSGGSGPKFFLLSMEQALSRWPELRECAFNLDGSVAYVFFANHPQRTEYPSEAVLAMLPPFLARNVHFPEYGGKERNYAVPGHYCLFETLERSLELLAEMPAHTKAFLMSTYEWEHVFWWRNNWTDWTAKHEKLPWEDPRFILADKEVKKSFFDPSRHISMPPALVPPRPEGYRYRPEFGYAWTGVLPPFAETAKAGLPAEPVKRPAAFKDPDGYRWFLTFMASFRKGKARKRIKELLPTNQTEGIVLVDSANEQEAKRFNYLELLSSSVFSLILSGDLQYSLRYVEVICSGAVPVLIQDQLVPPFEQIAPFESYGVRFREAEDLKEVIPTLRALYAAGEHKKKRRKALAFCHAHLASYYHELESTVGIAMHLARQAAHTGATLPSARTSAVASPTAPGPFEDPNADLPIQPYTAAVCIVGGARSFNDTFSSIVSNLLGGLKAPWPTDDAQWRVDVFAYIVVADAVYRKQVARLVADLPGLEWMRIDASGRDRNALHATFPAADAVLPLLENQTVASMLGNYFNYRECWRAILDRERSAGQRYQTVVRTRPDMLWIAPHPPLGLMAEVDRDAVFVPDAEHWGGINDRHTAFPRRLAPALLGVSSLFSNSDPASAIGLLWRCPKERGCNPETISLLAVRHMNGTALAFPPCSYLLESRGRDGLGIGYAESRGPAVGGPRYWREKDAVDRAAGSLRGGWEEAWKRAGRGLFVEKFRPRRVAV
ncbi:hypothetical protein DFJ74DRAFT_640549 [Hyaloraphidium curvatum]|nr:hypothetical protein DFJ74DRAFT_640549 [Hyaloraphidium curvatum]